MGHSKKKILITGAAGFIGSHLVKKLCVDHHVICVDDLSTGNLENLSSVMDQITWMKHDVVVPLEIVCDEIYHLACPASPPHYQKHPIKTIETSVLGSLNILKLAKKNKAKVFFASTSEVYGDPKQHPQKESYFGNVNSIGPRACYDESKRLAETLFVEFYKSFGVKVRIARIFNTYGPFMDPQDGRVITNLLHQALTGQPLTIYGDGSQTRSFCYIDDLIEGILKLMDQETIIGPVNLGNPEEVKILDVAELILSMTESSSKINFLPLPEDDPKLRCPDISFAKKHLLWLPNVSLGEGVQKTLRFYQTTLVDR